MGQHHHRVLHCTLYDVVVLCLQEIQGMWEGYKEAYSRLEPMRQELALFMQKKNASNKRKLAELQQSAEQLMAEAERSAPSWLLHC